MVQLQSASPTATAQRLKKPTVKDPRLIVGILLVAVSVWVGVWAVNSARGLDIAYVPKATIVAGQKVTNADLAAVEVNLADQRSLYLSTPLDDGAALVSTTTLLEGELIPSSSLTTVDAAGTRIVAITSHTQLPHSVRVGSKVDLWSTSLSSADGQAPQAQRIAEDLVIAEMPAEGTTFSSTRGQLVHVVVDDSRVSEVLSAQAADARLSLIAQPGDRS